MNLKQKVLIVDDEARNQRIISEVLEGLVDFKVASSGEEALKICEEYVPDLVLLDIMMPGINGYEVCKLIKANPKTKLTKVILVSGKAMIEERIKGYDEGADDYMTKPFIPEELLAKSKVFLRLTAIEKELVEFNASLDEKVKQKTQQLLETEGKLITSAKMSALGEMAGGIAHEINTPLGTIGLLAGQVDGLVLEDPIDVVSISNMLNIIKETVTRIGLIIHSLRTFSRDGSVDDFDSVPVKKIIDSTLMLCNEKLKQNGIEFQMEEIPQDLKIECQQVPISQVLINLINNACDAIELQKEKWIRLSIEDKGDTIALSITDSGNGISKEIAEKIFQPFFTTKEIGKGTGLGLSISKGIINSHKGNLAIDPDCKNTRFILQLPKLRPSK
ncbi:MAG: response regulator [Bdellovibrionota bacterium]